MKKLLLAVMATLLLFPAAWAQSPGTPTVVTDVLHYYFNKSYFKSGKTQLREYDSYKSAAATVTDITQVGSVFENGSAIELTGLETFACKTKKTGQTSVKMRLYLYSVNGNNLPAPDPIDSVEITVGDTTMQMRGGNFATTRTVTGNFAVCARNVSTHSGDTIKFLRTSSRTYTAWPNVPWSKKYSDGYGVIRFQGNFVSATNFAFPGFGYSTDFEFCVAPRVRYEIVAKEYWPQPVVDAEEICTFVPVTFTNASSPQIVHRMYNLLELYRKWNQAVAPLVAAPPGGWPADSSVVWKFENEDNALTGGRIFLPYGASSISYATDSVITPTCTDQNFFRVNHKSMNAFGAGPQISYSEQIPICIKYCAGMLTGIREQGYETLKAYPNPAVQGKAVITGLKGTTTLSVYNLQGQLLSTQASEGESALIDLGGLPDGVYILRVTGNGSRSIRLLKGPQ